MNYSRIILQVRAHLNLSQEELGRMIGVSFSTINRWENNKVIPTKKHMCVLENICEKNDIKFEVNKYGMLKGD